MEGGELRGEGPFSCPLVLLVMVGLVASSSANGAPAVLAGLEVSGEGGSPSMWDPACSLPPPAANRENKKIKYYME